MAKLDDYLALEDPLIAAVVAGVPELATVRGVQALPAPEELAKWALPAVLIAYRGDIVPGGDDNQAGPLQVVDQEWIAVLCIKNVADTKGGSGQRRTAGPLLMKLLRAVSGKQLHENFRPIKRAPGPRNEFGTAFALFPLVFRARVITS